MIGQVILDPKTGEPIAGDGKALTKSQYNPPMAVKKLFARVQKDYQTAWSLMHRTFDEFDGHSLLRRAELDQETFAAFVGAEYVPKNKSWRFRGRKNTSRNKLIGILAHMIVGMLYPFVYAQDDSDMEDKMTAKAMRILVEDKLRTAKYEQKFFYSVLCALVNPAVFLEVEYAEVLTTIRERQKNGEMKTRQVVDEMVSGLLLHVIPIDEIMLGDYYSGTGDIQAQPYIIRTRRISYDQARGLYSGRYTYEGKDVFDYVNAGQTHWLSSNEEQTLFDVEWDEIDANFVQEMTIYYRKDDLKLTWVGGVGMFDHEKPYDNPFHHRRMMLDSKTKEWYTVPVYPFAMSGFEPIDPAGRFVWFKSGAFKEYWDDVKLNRMDKLFVDATTLDVFKPHFLSGVAKVDQNVMAPGATVAMPQGANVTAYSMGPNLVAAMNVMKQAETDMSESTQDKIMQGQTQKGITATQTIEARQNARIFLGVFGFMIANLVKQVGELVMDIVIQYDTVGELDALTPGSLRMKYKAFLARGQEGGKDVTNRIIFTDKYIGRKMTEKQLREKEWDLYEQSGGEESDQRIWMINPYKFARTRYSMFIDADQIVQKSMGTDRLEKDRAFEKLMDPRVLPFVDPEAVANDFVIEEYAQGDPDRYKKKGGSDELIDALLGQVAKPAESPSQFPVNNEI